MDMHNRIAALGAMAVAIGGCRAEPQASVAHSAVTPAPVTGTAREREAGAQFIEERIPLTIDTHEGERRFTVEVARTDEQQRRGLMFRETLGRDRGMLFPYAVPAPQSFWMRNTISSLDLIFIGADGRITNIAARTTPLSLDPIPSIGPVIGVLEIDGGLAAELGIEPGDRVSWPNMEGLDPS